MEYPHIKFHIDGQVAIRSAEDYSDVTDKDLRTLFSQFREALTYMQEEIERRNLSQTTADGNYCGRLRKTADDLKVVERLNARGCKHMETAIQILSSPPKSRSVKVYQDFLHDIQRHCGSGILLLCAVGLGKQRIASMTEQDRIKLLRHVKEQKSSLSFPILEDIAKSYIPDKKSA